MIDPTERDEILFAFAVEPAHDPETVDRYLRQYPDLAAELVDLSAELRQTRVQFPTSPSTPDTGLEEAWQNYRACTPQTQSASVADNLFGRFKGPAFVALAATLNMPRAILIALRDRLVIAATIPESLVRRLSAATSWSAENVRAYLALPPVIAGTVNFKSDAKPEIQGQKSFQELVQNTEMTDEQRKLLVED